MKKILFSFSMFLIATAVAVAQQSLGDAARKARAQKKAPATIVVEGEGAPQIDNPTSASDSSRDTPASEATAADAKPKKTSAGPEKQKTDDWTAKIEAQKKEIALLQREVDVAAREQRLRAAAYYGDVGTQMRDQAKYAADSRKEQELIDTKKQALDQAQQKLADLQEQARKAGARVAD